MPGVADPADAPWSLPAVVPQRSGRLDGEPSVHVLGVLRTTRAEDGTGTLVANHDLLVVERADRVLRLDDGVLQAA